MTISVGDKLPAATLLGSDEKGAPKEVNLGDLTAGRKIVIFGLPGAFTGTCSTAHVPSFIRTRDDFAAKGVEDIICVSVNDAFVMNAWADSTGAKDAGILMLGDPASDFTKALGMAFDAPPAGLYGRSKRYAMLVEDGTVTVLNVEESPGVCEVSAGETLLGQI